MKTLRVYRESSSFTLKRIFEVKLVDDYRSKGLFRVIVYPDKSLSVSFISYLDASITFCKLVAERTRLKESYDYVKQ